MYSALKQSHRRITVRLRCPDADFLRHHPNRGVPDKAFAEIANRFSAYKVTDDRVELMLPQGHPDLNLLIELAKSLDLNIEPNRATKSQIEIMDYTKCSVSEILAAEYLEGRMSTPVFDSCVDVKEGKAFVFFNKSARTRNRVFGSFTNLPNLLFVRGAARSRLECSGLKGLQLRLLQTDRSDGEWPDNVEPLYLVSSSIELPPVDMYVFDDKGNVRAAAECDWGDKKARWYPLDGYEVQPLLKYRDGLPQADVALSKEHFGGFGEGYRRIIYSKKAKAVLEDIGMKLNWVPVRVGDK